MGNTLTRKTIFERNSVEQENINLAPKERSTIEDPESECPICFFNYLGLNTVTCCKGPICTTCYLDIKGSKGKKLTCPFCGANSFKIMYEKSSASGKNLSDDIQNDSNAYPPNKVEEQTPVPPPIQTRKASTTTVVLATVDDRESIENEIRNQRRSSNHNYHRSSSYNSYSISPSHRIPYTRSSSTGTTTRHQDNISTSNDPDLSNMSPLQDLLQSILMGVPPPENYRPNRRGPPIRAHMNAAEIEEMMILQAIELSLQEASMTTTTSTSSSATSVIPDSTILENTLIETTTDTPIVTTPTTTAIVTDANISSSSSSSLKDHNLEDVNTVNHINSILTEINIQSIIKEDTEQRVQIQQQQSTSQINDTLLNNEMNHIDNITTMTTTTSTAATIPCTSEDNMRDNKTYTTNNNNNHNNTTNDTTIHNDETLNMATTTSNVPSNLPFDGGRESPPIFLEQDYLDILALHENQQMSVNREYEAYSNDDDEYDECKDAGKHEDEIAISTTMSNSNDNNNNTTTSNCSDTIFYQNTPSTCLLSTFHSINNNNNHNNNHDSNETITTTSEDINMIYTMNTTSYVYNSSPFTPLISVNSNIDNNNEVEIRNTSYQSHQLEVLDIKNKNDDSDNNKKEKENHTIEEMKDI